jgi:hypothetical protein
MKNKLFHPMWTHIPVLAVLIVCIVYTIISGPLPSHAPVHFDINGEPNQYGSPWLVFGIAIGITLFFLAVSAIIDENWVRQEKNKSFNWFCLLDELFGGFIGGMYLGYLNYINMGSIGFTFPWGTIGLVTGMMLILAIILEIVRPFNPHPRPTFFGDTSQMENEVAGKLREDTAFIYWQSQNPFWVSLLSVVLPLVMITAGVYAAFDIWWVGLIVGVAGLLSLLMYGGMRTSVTKNAVTVRFGMVGKILNLKTGDIGIIELKEFAPIGDFGGWGIRYNGKMWGYYLRGNRGVKLTAQNGKNYLIGSDQPEELYAVIQAVVKNR